MKNENNVNLSFFFDEDIKFVTELIGIFPDKTWLKGVKTLGNIGSIYHSNGFEITSGLGKYNDIESHINSIILKINNNIYKIIENKNIFEIQLGIYVYINDTHNGIHLNKKIINILNEIGAEIYIDIYNTN